MTKILEVKDLEISFDTYAGKVRENGGENFHFHKVIHKDSFLFF